MTDSTNPGQMHVRLARFLPRDLAAKVSPRLIAECCKAAWANGWRDAEWLATYALEGTEMPNVTNAAAMFTAQLRDAASQPCPVDATPTPPRAIPRNTDIASDEARIRGIEACRKALRQ